MNWSFAQMWNESFEKDIVEVEKKADEKEKRMKEAQEVLRLKREEGLRILYESGDNKFNMGSRAGIQARLVPTPRPVELPF